MTKQEFISKTEYTEEQLINLALAAFKEDLRKLRDNPENGAEEWLHYEDLRLAVGAILEERR